MTSIAWPGSLPIPKIPGLSAQYQKAIIRTEMDAGPAKQRQRYTAVPKTFTGTITVKKADMETLDSFFANTLGYGTLRFTMADPQSGTACEFRFTDSPAETGNDGGLFDISLPLERLV